MGEPVTFCPECGGIVSKDFRYCPRCGSPLSFSGEGALPLDEVVDASLQRTAAVVHRKTFEKLESLESSLSHLEEEIDSFLASGGKKE